MFTKYFSYVLIASLVITGTGLLNIASAQADAEVTQMTRPDVEELSQGAKLKDGMDSTLVTKKLLLKKLEVARQKAELSTSAERTKIKSRKPPKDSKEVQQQFTDLKSYNGNLKNAFQSELDKFSKQERDALEYVEPNYLFELEGLYAPNDVNLSNAWYNRSILAQNPNQFSTVATLNRPIVVAVIDTGVDYTHQELSGVMWSTSRCVDEYGILKASACTNGYDFFAGDSDPFPNDSSFHGTAVASLIGAATDNGVGIASLAQNRTRIMSLRVSDGGTIELDKIIKAVYFAIYNGVDIINMSFASPTYSQNLQDAISFAESRGITIVAAAGNHSANIDFSPEYPASYKNQNVIAVAATDKTGNIASFSNLGPNTVDVAAPGYQIYMASPGNTYASYNGTSFSAPIISAYIARGISEGRNTWSSLALIPKSTSASGVNGERVLGAPVSSDPVTDVNPFVLLDDGSMLNVYTKGGGSSSGFSLQWQSVNLQADPTIGFATQISPGSAPLGTTLPNPIPVVTGTSATLMWQSVVGAGSYGVYLCDHTLFPNSSCGDLSNDVLPVSVTSKTYNNLVPGHIYRWNTVARKTTTSIGTSNENLTKVYFFSIGGATPAPSNGPTSISPVTTTAPGYLVSTATSLNVSWSGVTNATYYNVAWRDLDTNILYDSSALNPTGLSYSISNLIVGHKYRMDIAACNVTACSLRSANYYFYLPTSTTPPPAPTVIQPISPAFPGVSTGSSITVSWQPVANATSYNIAWTERTSSDVQVGQVQQQTVSGTSYAITGLQAGKWYRFDLGTCVNSICTLNSSRSPNNYFYVPPSTTGFDLLPVSLSSSPNTGAPGQTVTLTYGVKNQGTSNITTPFKVGFYVSSQGVGPSSTNFLGEVSVASLSAGATTNGTASVVLPTAASAAYVGNGQYYISMLTDKDNVVTEGSVGESNNLSSLTSSTVITMSGLNSSSQQITVPTNITSKTAGTGFPFSITTTGVPAGTTLNLKSSGGNITPSSVTSTVTGATPTVTLSSPGMQTITASVAGSGASATTNSFSVSPPTGSTGTSPQMTVIIKDKVGNPLPGVTIKVTCASGLNTCNPNSFGALGGITSSNGSVSVPTATITAVSPGAFIIASYLGVTENWTEQIPSQSSVVYEETFNSLWDTSKVPIILLPGIMGSTYGSELEVIPYLPGGTVEVAKLHLADAGLTHLVGWGQLKDALEGQGYTLGKNIIDCPYDWRLSMDVVANTTLKDCVDKALKFTTTGKVDIVAHSQGGLVARAYIQGNGAVNASKIRKLAFLGTPQYGATEAYFSWEGGEALGFRGKIVARTLAHSNVNVGSMTGSATYNLLGLSVDSCTTNSGDYSADNINVANNLISFSEGRATVWIKCVDGTNKLLYLDEAPNFVLPGPADWAIKNKILTRGFIQANAPAVKQLLPIYDFIKSTSNGSATTITSANNQNEFLRALNNKPCIDGSCNEYSLNSSGYSYVDFNTSKAVGNIEVKQFYSNDGQGPLPPAIVLWDHRAVQDIVKQTVPGYLGLYEDGIPETVANRSKVYGDGTVPYGKSIQQFLTDYNLTSIGQDVSSDHSFLVSNSIPYLVPFLTGSTATLSSAELNSVEQKMNVSVTGQVQVKISDPQGRVLGVDPITGIGSNNIPQADVTVDNGRNLFSIPSPVDGTYTLTISGPIATDFDFYSDFQSDTHSEPHEFIGYHKAGAVDTITFSLNGGVASDSKVFIHPFDRSPIGVKAIPAGSLTSVAWSAPVSGATKYRVYTKFTGDATVTYLGETTSLSFPTSYAFAGANVSLARQFYVSAVDASGQESYLSLPVQNNDTDGDGVSDDVEISLGSSPVMVDSDGDGLTDGQEYFLYGTNPALADSDNNGVNDYAQVVAAIQAALNASNTPPPPTSSNSHSIQLSRASAQYLHAGSDSNYGGLNPVGNITVEGWFKLSSLPVNDTNGRFTILSKGDGTSAGIGQYLLQLGASGFYAQMNDTGHTAFAPWTSASVGVWHHIAWTMSAGGGATGSRFYVDGIQIGQDNSVNSLNASTNDLIIGATKEGASITKYFDGELDDLRLWSSVRSNQEILDNMSKELTGTESNLVSYWRFNNTPTAARTPFYDVTPINNPVYLVDPAFGIPQVAPANPMPASLDLERDANQSMKVLDSQQTGLNVLHALTIESWFKLESLPTDNSFGRFTIASKGTGDTSGTSQYLLQIGVSGFFAQMNGTSVTASAPWTGIETGKWHHIAWVMSGQGISGSSFYLDGVLIGSDNGVLNLNTSNGEFIVGATKETSGYVKHFDGKLDELSVWNIARTQQDIVSSKDSSLNGNELGLVGYWKFNNTSDASPISNSLLPVGAPSYDVVDMPFGYTPPAPAPSSSVHLTRAATQSFNLPNSTQVGLNPSGSMTIESWFNLDSLPTDNNFGRFTIASKGCGDSGCENQYLLQLGQSGFFAQMSGTGATANVPWPGIETGKWHHIAWVMDSTHPGPGNNGSSMYLDGQLLGQDNAVSQISATSYDFLVGTTYQSSGLVKYFDGLLDDLRIWNTARTQTEIQTNRNNELTGSEPGLVGYWKFSNDGKASGSVNNLVEVNTPTYQNVSPFTASVSTSTNRVPTLTLSGANPLTVTQGAPYIEPGFIATDAEDGFINPSVTASSSVITTIPGTYSIMYTVKDLAGAATSTSRTVIVVTPPPPSNTQSLTLVASTTQYASITDASQTTLDVTGALSLEAWIKPASLNTASVYTVASKFSTNSQRSYALQLQAVSNVWQLKMTVDQTGTNATTSYKYGTYAFAPNNWYHVAGTFDPVSKTIRVYVNGKEVTATAGYSFKATSVFNSAAPFRIGAAGTSATAGSQYFDGIIDEVRIWNSLRTPSDILLNYNKSLVGNETGLVGYWRLNNNYSDSAKGNTLTPTNNPAFSPLVGFAVDGIETTPVFTLAGTDTQLPTTFSSSTDPVLIGGIADISATSSEPELISPTLVPSIPTIDGTTTPTFTSTTTPEVISTILDLATSTSETTTNISNPTSTTTYASPTVLEISIQ